MLPHLVKITTNLPCRRELETLTDWLTVIYADMLLPWNVLGILNISKIYFKEFETKSHKTETDEYAPAAFVLLDKLIDNNVLFMLWTYVL